MKNPGAKRKVTAATADELADALGITSRRVQQLAEQGIIPAPKKRGEYDWIACTAAFLRHSKETSKQSENKTTLELETIREKKLMNDDREFEALKKRGAFVPLAAVEEFFDGVIPQWDSKITAIKTRLVNFLRTNSDPEKTTAYAVECVDEILSELASTNPADFISPEKIKDADTESVAQV